MPDFLFDQGKNKIEGSPKTTVDAIGAATAANTQKSNLMFGEMFEGFTPSYIEGSITEYNGKAVFNVSSSWVYVNVNVSALVGETLTISTYADRQRKILYCDDSENVIESYTIDTGNPNLYSTIETVVPANATKCYINKWATGTNDVEIEGYREVRFADKKEVPDIVQSTGNSENAVISQKGVTELAGNTIESVIPQKNVVPVTYENVAVYIDNMFRGISPKKCRCVTCPNVHINIFDQYIALIPNNYGNESGQIRLHLIDDFKYDRNGTIVYSATQEVEKEVKALFIGDSITENLSYLTPLKSISDNGNLKIEFLGTLGTTIKNEGRQGWAAYTYCNLATYGDKSNAFWDGSKFNFPYYMTQNEIETPDYIFINLGTNDLIRGVTNPNDDNEVKSVMITNYITMINSIRDYSSNIPVILWLPPTRSLIGQNTHSGIDNALRANKFLIEEFDKLSYISNKVYLMPTYLFVNPYTDYTSEQITINGETFENCNEPIHPTQAGGEKIAKGIIRQINYIENL